MSRTLATPRTPPQQVVKFRRDYNSWVASETMEDYALRFTPRTFRKWSEWRVANTAFGAASFLILEAVGATLLVQYGFANAALAILATGLIIFAAGLPISVYAARHGVDMDLLTRGAGFGYLGSTITSLIYASFTFIFFALEAAVMAYALELAFDIPPAWGYGICALVVIPLVSHGVTAISRLQVWTQPLWLAMLLLPLGFVLFKAPGELAGLTGFAGIDGRSPGFSGLGFGAALTVGIALITQMGEQADYLRFMPEKRPGHAARWWFGTLMGGPGWVVMGVLKMMAGVTLAYLALAHMVPPERAVDPNQMYLAAWEYVFPNYSWAVAATALFVLVSQLKINVTNAYAGSLAWSNFFSRLTHHHPGRVVWVVFNTVIALVLMELNVFQALSHVLGLYSNIAIAWMMTVVADLVINKPLGLSPRGIEFRRAHLYDVNPVGVGAMGVASVLSIAAHGGAFGPMAQAWSAMIALVVAMVASPLIAWATGGRYYLARRTGAARRIEATEVARPGTPTDAPPGAYLGAQALRRCTICERDYEPEDMAACPAYGGLICSLCCTLDARCDDLCKPQARLSAQWLRLLQRLLPARMAPQLQGGLSAYLLLMCGVVPGLALLFGALYALGLRSLGTLDAISAAAVAPLLRAGFGQAFAVLLLIAGMVAWWAVLAQRSRALAQEESRRQTQALNQQALALHQQAAALRHEIESHQRTDAQLQQAKVVADAANQAKSRYITAISHELRTPLNSILGYAQLLEDDPAIPAHRRGAVQVIRRGGDHLLSLIEGTLDIARIESGRLALEPGPMHFAEGMDELVRLFEAQAAERGLRFVHTRTGTLPELVRADEKRLRQILINLLGNAVKFTRVGQVSLRVDYAREMARFEIEDTGPGMSEAELAQVFEPFVRGTAAGGNATTGTGLGLTIARMLTGLMGGELTVRSTPGQGSCFAVRLYLPELQARASPRETRRALRHTGYLGPRRRLLVVDNEEADRRLLVDRLAPLGFELLQAGSGEAALALLTSLRDGEPVDAMFLDLAMPGIDGWTTLRRLRDLGLSDAPAAIVSANAFDQGLENDLGIARSDFLVKPVRMTELQGWLQRRLGLQWVDEAALPPVEAPAAALVPPPAAALQALAELVRLGYLRGIQKKLDAIDSEHPASAAFTARLRALARGFQLDTLASTLQTALAEVDPATNPATTRLPDAA
ncbi:MAG: hybrid sensor histidine kinase/response regulator [Burkholderiales bacterium RIFCSPHIGHO2_12_FULL_69_20]|nr:MAG: hybrid sensor histidine kinase/response regulator [Burkholderiales bacterium RIFCSPHIGHO2_12_FULL_69_20]